MPDEELLALWVEDELQGPEAAAVEAWAVSQPEWLERRDQARQMKSLLQAHLPAVIEPPYADFFNSRISREIAREAAGAVPVTGPSSAAAAVRSGLHSFWRFFLPTTAVAGMALCFWAGTRAGNRAVPGPSVGQAGPVLYTPEKGVSADYFNSDPADAMVIVLDGVSAIPDTFELPDTAAVEKEEPATASLETTPR